MYQLLMPSLDARTRFIQEMRIRDIQCVFHYIPLHSSPAGKHFGRENGSLDVTDRISETLVRLPLWVGLENQLDYIMEAADAALLASI